MVDNSNGKGPTKADVIMQKITRFDGQIEEVEGKISNLASAVDESKALAESTAKSNLGEHEQLKTEIKYVSAQLESVCVMLNMSLNKLAAELAELKKKQTPDLDELASRVAAKIIIPDVERNVQDIDYDALGYAVAKSIYVPNAVAEEIDYEDLASKIAEKMPAPEYVAPVVEQPVVQPVQTEIDYDLLAAKVAEAVNSESVSCDYIAARVAEQIVVPEPIATATTADIDIDELSSLVAEKIVIPQQEVAPVSTDEYSSYQVVDVDGEQVAEEVVSRLTETIADTINSDEIADCVAKRVGSISPEEFEITVDDDGCDSLAKVIAERLDYDMLAAKVAERIAPTYMDMGGADSIDTEELANAISDKLTVNAAVNEDALAEKAAAILSNYMPEVDNADIADKVIAGVIPAIPTSTVIDGEEIADVVTTKVTDAIDCEQIADAVSQKVAETVDYTQIADAVSAKILENQTDSDFDIVIDDEGVAVLSENINEGVKGEITKLGEEQYERIEEEINRRSEEQYARIEEGINRNSEEQYTRIEEEINRRSEEQYTKIEEELNRRSEEHYEKIGEEINAVKEEYTSRFSKIDEDIEELKNLILAGAVVIAATNDETAAAAEPVEEIEEVEEEVVEEVVEEPVEEVVEEVVEEEEEQLVTVSDIVGEEVTEEEEQPEDEVIDEIVNEIDEEPADGEIMPDGMEEEGEGGVDFANMMKYNRSFIARIIQGTDDQKNYYGEVKTALLSYKKVNSNIAWGAERFNKGRETIARFKIRGKTLCLYLALDPNEFETSVYHQADVSDNKSMHGTPMMVKIKSPRGVKKAIRLIDTMLERRDGIKRTVAQRDYAAMYPYETMEELIEDGLVKDVSKK